MSFVTPWLALAGVIAVSVPLLIHLLFRQRRRPVMWGAMRLLQEALRRHRTRLRLQNFILLALRCLTVLLLGAALAQPLLRAAGLVEAGNARIVYLVIDDGLASSAGTAPAASLARSVDAARSIVQGLAPGDAVGIILASQPARALLSPPSTDLGAIEELLDSLQPAQTPTDLPGALSLLAAQLDAAPEAPLTAACLLSDFRQGSASLEDSLTRHPLPTEGVRLLSLPPAAEPLANIQITDVSPFRALILPGQTDGSGRVGVKLRRGGGELGRQHSMVRLSGDSIRPVEPRRLAWEPGQSEASIDFTVEFLDADSREAALTAAIDDDSLAADNARFVILESRRQLRITIVDLRRFNAQSTMENLSAGQWIRWALKPSDEAPIDLVEIEPAALDATTLNASDAAVIARPDLLTDQGWADLRDFIDRGGLALVTPPGDVTIHTWVDTMLDRLDLPWTIDLEATISADGEALAEVQPGARALRMVSTDLNDLASPIRVFKRLRINADQTQADRILLMRDQSPLIITGSPRASEGDAAPRGLVTFIAAAPELDWTNLPGKPLMVPLMQELVREGLGAIRSSRPVLVGDRPALAGLRAGAAAVDVITPTDERLAVDRRGVLDRPLAIAGAYRAVDVAGQTVGRLAVNIQPDAARTETLSSEAVLSWLNGSGAWTYLDPADPLAPLRSADASVSLSAYLLPLLLLVAISEAVLAGWWGPRAKNLIDQRGVRSSVGAAIREAA